MADAAHALPPWAAVDQQTQRWLKAGVLEAIVHDLRMLLRLADGRTAQPSATILESRTRQSSSESGPRAGDDGAKRRRGSQVHGAVDPPGHLLAWPVTPADAQDRAEVEPLTVQVQEVTGEVIEVALVDQGDTGDPPAQDAAVHDMHLEVVQLPEAKNDFVRLPRRWVVERSVAWTARFRRLAREDGRLPATLAGLHVLAFAILLLTRFVALMVQRA